ncbi:MAG TPA: shikimate dehydrogenase [Pyrinomonadaceae bacterium]|nr:shikimate dehydrogenase [Pyrinomonadaceae bacterium]
MSKTASSDARLCVPAAAERAGDLPAAVARAARLADLVELRLDYLEDDRELRAARDYLHTLLRDRPLPLVLTLRPAEQGGRRELTTAARLDFWSALARDLRERQTRPPDFVDLELDLLEDRAHSERLRELRDGCPVICSHHAFAGPLPELEPLYERMAATGARVLKIAVAAHDAIDCLPVLRLLERARRDGRALVALAMSDAGLLTRVLGPARGAFLAYAAADEASATAPGQASAEDLRGLYRFDRLGAATQICGLVGSPVAHSLSPQIHNAAFAALGLDAVYIPFEVRDLRAFMRRMIDPRTRELDWRLRGLSVTAPHKSGIIDALDSVDESAREIGAVNTILIEDDNELRGYNTDADAALAPLAGLVELREASAAVLGAGGAARAVLRALRLAGARSTVFARDEERARAAARKFGASLRQLSGARFGDFDLVVNTTPLGTRGGRESQTAATAEQLRGARAAYDLVYNPAETRFMREARAAGCPVVVGGLPMLVAQAAAQFELWTGRPAPLDVMRRAAENRLSTQSVADDVRE